MNSIKTLRIRNLGGTLQQEMPIGSDSIYITRNGKSDAILEDALVSIEADAKDANGRLNLIEGSETQTGSMQYWGDWYRDKANEYTDKEVEDLKKDIKENVVGLQEGASINSITYPTISSLSSTLVATIGDPAPEDYNTIYKIGSNLQLLNNNKETTGSIKEQISTAVTNLINGASEDYNTLKEIEESVDGLNQATNKRIDDLLGGVSGSASYNTIKKINDNLVVLNGNNDTNGSIKEQISTAITNLINGADYKTLKDIQTLLENIQENEPGGLDSLKDLADAYTKLSEQHETELSNLIGTVPENAKYNTVEKINANLAVLNGSSTKTNSIDERITDAVSALKNNATSGYDTLGGLESKVKTVDQKVDNAIGSLASNAKYSTIAEINDVLTTLVGDGESGSIDTKINNAVTELKGSATSAMDTLGKVETLFNSIKENDSEGLDSLKELADYCEDLNEKVNNLPAIYGTFKWDKNNVQTGYIKVCDIVPEYDKISDFKIVKIENGVLSSKIVEDISPADDIVYVEDKIFVVYHPTLNFEEKGVYFRINNEESYIAGFMHKDCALDILEEVNTLKYKVMQLDNKIYILELKVENESPNSIVTKSIQHTTYEGVTYILSRYGYIINIEIYGNTLEAYENLKTLTINIASELDLSPQNRFRNFNKWIFLNNIDNCLLTINTEGELSFSNFTISNIERQDFYISESFTFQPIDSITFEDIIIEDGGEVGGNEPVYPDNPEVAPT